jgi:hypothetical protein
VTVPADTAGCHQDSHLSQGAERTKLLLAGPAVRDEGPGPLDRRPRVKRRPAELGAVRKHVHLVGAAYHELFQTGLDRAGLADAEPGVERVRPEERPVRCQPRQAELGQRADEALTDLPQVAAQADDLHAFGVGKLAERGHSVGDDGEVRPVPQPPGEPAGRGSGVEDQGLAVADEGRGEAGDLLFLRRRHGGPLAQRCLWVLAGRDRAAVRAREFAPFGQQRQVPADGGRRHVERLCELLHVDEALFGRKPPDLLSALTRVQPPGSLAQRHFRLCSLRARRGVCRLEGA